jgi:23S rRNA pseudouridine955/2504/2580 synthase
MTEEARVTPGVQWLTVDADHEGQRLDNFLIGSLKGVPRSWIYRVMRRGEVRVNKGRCKPDRRIHAGDVVRIPPVRQATRATAGPPRGLIEQVEAAIIHEDARLLIVNKPSGIAVHGGSGLSHGIIEILRASRPDAPFLELAHRLDRDTSGCLMLCKKRSVLRELQDLQRSNRVEKHYSALLLGALRKGRWKVDQPLRKNTLQSGERVVRVDPEGKPALTRFSRVRRFAAYTLVDAKLETGRTHQIRVHAAACGHPIVGDAKYGDEAMNQAARRSGLRRLFLHARSLSWNAAGGLPALRIEAPLGNELETFLEKIAIDET